jgi:hypothetical protein
MHRPLALLTLVAAICPWLACDETPRGEQGIDFLDDGAAYTVPPSPEAGPDAHGPCADETDTAGVCTNASVAGVPFANLVTCTGSAPPTGISCISAADAGQAGLTSYCCSTGIL